MTAPRRTATALRDEGARQFALAAAAHPTAHPLSWLGSAVTEIMSRTGLTAAQLVHLVMGANLAYAEEMTL